MAPTGAARIGQIVYDGNEGATGDLAGHPYPPVDERDAIELITQIHQGTDSDGERAAEPLKPSGVPVVDSFERHYSAERVPDPTWSAVVDSEGTIRDVLGPSTQPLSTTSLDGRRGRT